MIHKSCKFCQNLKAILEREGVPTWYLEDEKRWQKFHNSKLHKRYENEEFIESLSMEDKIKHRFNLVHGTKYILAENKS